MVSDEQELDDMNVVPIDGQRRIPVPARMRQKGLKDEVVLTIDNRDEILMFNDFEGIARYAESFTKGLPDQIELVMKELLLRKATQAKLDSRGRVAVPKSLFQRAGLVYGGKASLFTMDGYFRITTVERAAAYYEAMLRLVSQHDPLKGLLA
ncbi:MAG: hypothetical protein HQ523_09095 [Lentisphaerae bacterium]|nr:hypothetical protein [Lentisphaerota bacterium]